MFLCFFHVVHFFPTNLRSWPDSCSFLLTPNTSDVKYVAFGLVKGPATRTYSMWYSRCFVKQLFFLRILRIVRSFTLRSELLFPGFWELLLGRLVASFAATDLKKFQRLTFFQMIKWKTNDWRCRTKKNPHNCLRFSIDIFYSYFYVVFYIYLCNSVGVEIFKNSCYLFADVITTLTYNFECSMTL